MNAESLPSRARPLRAGDPRRIGAYDVLGFLGEGGMGVVFLGRSPDRQLVAIKVVREELAKHPEFRARFRREAESAIRVPRFCTAEVLAADPDAAAPYLVTEYIDGPTLEEVVKKEGPLRGAELDQLGVSMAAALTGIHSTGVIHRDLKPANVLLSRVGPRVIDFGIASAVDAIRLTADGQALGTPTYMAPEQLHGNPVQASDVFCWGGVMAYAATGRRPFGTGPLPEVAARIVYESPDLEGMDGPLRAVVMAAMQKEPSVRPTPAQLLQMLGVSGTDPELAVRTRLEGLGLPMGQVQLDHPERTRPDLATRAFDTPPPPPRPDETGDVSLRFGPGISAADPIARTWRSGESQQTRRRRRWNWIRSLVSTLISLAIIVGVVAWLLLHNKSTPDFAVTGLDVSVDKAKQTCNANADITGTVTTNGEAGQLVYQWQKSDEATPEPQKQQDIPSGQKTVALHYIWQISGRSTTRTFTATLTILNTPSIQKTATFTYTCRSS